ncbi:MAG: hypothetical protein WDO73_03950 [Ignavibacteriota bacterium]
MSGPSATFPDGGQSLTVQTDVHGVAAARGLRPNTIAGQFQIRVSTSLRGATADTSIVQTNAEPVLRSSHTKLVRDLSRLWAAPPPVERLSRCAVSRVQVVLPLAAGLLLPDLLSSDRLIECYRIT